MPKFTKSDVFLLAAIGAVASAVGLSLQKDYDEFYKTHLPLGKIFLEQSGFTEVKNGKSDLGSAKCPKYVWSAQYEATSPEGQAVTKTVCFNATHGIHLSDDKGLHRQHKIN